MSDQQCERNPDMCATGREETYVIEGRRENPTDRRDWERTERDWERHSNLDNHPHTEPERSGGDGRGGGVVIVAHPVDLGTKTYDTSPFKVNCKVNTKWSEKHKAIDVASSINRFGEEVRSIVDGIVEAREERPSNDLNYSAVIIRGNDGYLTVHGHVKYRDGLNVGDTVHAGDVIGTTDNSGVFEDAHGNEGPCPNLEGIDCSHVHIARVKALYVHPLNVFDEVLKRVRPKHKGGKDEGDRIKLKGC